jgi:Putative zinc-finger
MTRHVDAEMLARFRQGELSPRRNSRIRSHLAGCRRCSELNEDLAGVTTLLASVPPPPIPEHLTARIHSALAAEAARRATVTAGSAPAALSGTAAPGDTGPAVTAAGLHDGAGAPQDGAPQPQRERAGPGWRLPRLSSPVGLRVTAAAAALVIIAGGSYEIGVHASGGTSGASSAQSAPNGAASAAAGTPPGARAYGPALAYQHAGHQARVTPVTTDTVFTPGQLKREVTSELTQYSPGKVRAAAPNSMAPNAAHSPAAPHAQASAAFGIPVDVLDGCVNRIAAGELVLLVDVAHYQGVRATVIVTEVSASSPEDIWVVGMGCSGSRSDVLTHTVLAGGG